MNGLLRSNLTVAAGTALSRVSGLVRVAVFLYVLGGTALADAYTIGNETPNIVYDLLLGGVLSATLVPLFTAFAEPDRDGRVDRDAANAIITFAVTAMTALTVIAVVAAPLIFGIYSITPADDVDAEVFREVGTLLTRIFLVQILFYGLTGLANAYLNSRRRFFAAAWSPILPNVIIAITLLSLPGAGSTVWTLDDVLTNDRLRWTLGLGATAGIATMALVLVPAVLRAGFDFRPVWNWRHPAVRRLLTLSGWTLGFVAANQATLVFVKNLAAPGSGDATAYTVAFTFFVLPHALLAVSISTTFQPEMSRAVARRDRLGFIRQASLGARLIALMTLPAGVLIFVLRDPIVGLALQRGAFDAEAALATSRALAGFSLGLVGFSVYMFVLRGFYAHQDTRTPFVINLFENGLNIVLAFVLVGRWGVLGLGLALSLAYLVASVWALQVMSYKVPGFPARDIVVHVGRMVLGAVLMAEVVWLVTRQVGGTTGVDALVRLVVGGVVGVVVYVGVLAAQRVPELEAVRRQVGERVRRPASSVAK